MKRSATFAVGIFSPLLYQLSYPASARQNLICAHFATSHPWVASTEKRVKMALELLPGSNKMARVAEWDEPQFARRAFCQRDVWNAPGPCFEGRPRLPQTDRAARTRTD
jgi:hypothetical protein